MHGGLYGTAATLDDTPDNPTLENSGRDVKHETDSRGVYARVIDDWLGADSVSILGGDFRNQAVNFVYRVRSRLTVRVVRVDTRRPWAPARPQQVPL